MAQKAGRRSETTRDIQDADADEAMATTAV